LKGMILCAGRGERMRPLTDTTPKSLLCAKDKPLIQYHLERFAAVGVNEVVINYAHLGEQIRDFCGDGSAFGVSIVYSPERSALETGGGILKALPHFGSDPFIVVNADVWTDFPFSTLLKCPNGKAHLVLVANPPEHPEGDFCLPSGVDEGQIVSQCDNQDKYTFSGISLLSASLFENCKNSRFPLGPLLRVAISEGAVTGEYYEGVWFDVGTPDRLNAVQNYLDQLGEDTV